jgi:hypothetical protein
MSPFCSVPLTKEPSKIPHRKKTKPKTTQKKTIKERRQTRTRIQKGMKEKEKNIRERRQTGSNLERKMEENRNISAARRTVIHSSTPTFHSQKRKKPKREKKKRMNEMKDRKKGGKEEPIPQKQNKKRNQNRNEQKPKPKLSPTPHANEIETRSRTKSVPFLTPPQKKNTTHQPPKSPLQNLPRPPRQVLLLVLEGLPEGGALDDGQDAEGAEGGPAVA